MGGEGLHHSGTPHSILGEVMEQPYYPGAKAGCLTLLAFWCLIVVVGLIVS